MPFASFAAFCSKASLVAALTAALRSSVVNCRLAACSYGSGTPVNFISTGVSMISVGAT